MVNCCNIVLNTWVPPPPKKKGGAGEFLKQTVRFYPQKQLVYVESVTNHCNVS